MDCTNVTIEKREPDDLDIVQGAVFACLYTLYSIASGEDYTDYNEDYMDYNNVINLRIQSMEDIVEKLLSDEVRPSLKRLLEEKDAEKLRLGRHS